MSKNIEKVNLDLNNFKLSVIITTSAETPRKNSILQAIKSIQQQQGVQSDIIIVANGKNCDINLLNQLSKIESVYLHHFPDKDLPEARIFGREQVKTPYFSFLDDDDEYIFNTLKIMISSLEQEKNIDIAVGNGFRHINNIDHVRFERISEIKGNELRSLITTGGNWLASCAAIYRTSSIGKFYFSDLPKYCEWTYLAFKLSLEKNIDFIDVNSYRIHDSQNSLSKGIDYQLGEYDSLQKIKSLNLPLDIKNAVSRKITDQAHTISGANLKLNNLSGSLHYHFISLYSLYGLKYLIFTRKILLTYIRNLFRLRTKNRTS